MSVRDDYVAHEPIGPGNYGRMTYSRFTVEYEYLPDDEDTRHLGQGRYVATCVTCGWDWGFSTAGERARWTIAHLDATEAAAPLHKQARAKHEVVFSVT